MTTRQNMTQCVRAWQMGAKTLAMLATPVIIKEIGKKRDFLDAKTCAGSGIFSTLAHIVIIITTQCVSVTVITLSDLVVARSRFLNREF